MITQPFKAAGAFLKALPLVLSKDLRVFILIPLLANFALMALIYMLAFGYFQDLLGYAMGYVPEWVSFLNWLFYLIFGAIITVLLFYSFSVGVNILAAPFMAFLAEKVEEKETGRVFDERLTMGVIMAMVGRSLLRECQKIGYFLPRFILLLLLSFIPLVNVIAPVLLLSFSAWMLALQYMDYAFDNNKVTFHNMRMALRSKPLLCWTFGGMVMVSLTIPFFNLFVMPIAVVAATLLWISVFRSEQEKVSTWLDRTDGTL
ncbi:sulfate transporter CysZ [Marinomonas sp. M1K-6]|uniref:Sulfate transporter CysZ n=1 Tax=Marinomonas profundi TaxID=2726122 RepID=A0A847R571_9GAMM|nr:sulfate transporter CysZ [Marinomonas profundi]NLQ17206.1 sulfate transporter CysZ [Marinomonas profundi]UDV04602.1 sulfate transporter CysZ [Marinomonas profundi]